MPKNARRTTVTATSTPASEPTTERYLHLHGDIGVEVDLTRRPKTPAEFVAGIAIVFREGTLRGFRLEGFSVWDQREQEGRQTKYPARKYMYVKDGENLQGTYVLLRTVDDGDFMPRRRLNDLIYEAVDAAISRAQ
jgi:hypothetical protein